MEQISWAFFWIDWIWNVAWDIRCPFVETCFGIAQFNLTGYLFFALYWLLNNRRANLFIITNIFRITLNFIFLNFRSIWFVLLFCELLCKINRRINHRIYWQFLFCLRICRRKIYCWLLIRLRRYNIVIFFRNNSAKRIVSLILK